VGEQGDYVFRKNFCVVPKLVLRKTQTSWKTVEERGSVTGIAGIKREKGEFGSNIESIEDIKRSSAL